MRRIGTLQDSTQARQFCDYLVTLSIDADGTPQVVTTRGDKTLKSVPAKLRKDDDIVSA